jgi:transposase
VTSAEPVGHPLAISRTLLMPRLREVQEHLERLAGWATVARELKVSRMSISRWYRQWKKSGTDALKAVPRAGSSGAFATSW